MRPLHLVLAAVAVLLAAGAVTAGISLRDAPGSADCGSHEARHCQEHHQCNPERPACQEHHRAERIRAHCAEHPRDPVCR